MENFQPFVYGLCDPVEPGHVRYVGMAPSNPTRPYQHAKRARKDLADDSYLMHWIRKIQAEGREPSVMILEQLNEGIGRKFLGFVETCYIRSLREIGHRLTNENDGGWGGSNGPHTSETIAKMKAGWTPEVRAKVGEASRERLLGKSRSMESREKQSKTITGRRFSVEHRANISAARKALWDNATVQERTSHAESVSNAMKGRGIGNRNASVPWPDERRAAHSDSFKGNQNNLGNKASDETCAKQSAAARAAWAKRKGEQYD